MKYHINHEFVSITSQTATHRIILIHGWVIPIGREIKENSEIDFEVIALRAPGLHPSGAGRQWYGLYPHDWKEAEEEVNRLLLSLKKFDITQIPLKKTILLGFSQGAAMAIETGCKLDLGLIVSCSGYPHPNWLPDKKCPPMIISHGLMDDIVPIEASRSIYERVDSKSYNFCKLIEFAGNHQIDLNLIDIINSKIKDIF